jgi:hypothetical protein
MGWEKPGMTWVLRQENSGCSVSTMRRRTARRQASFLINRRTPQLARALPATFALLLLTAVAGWAGASNGHEEGTDRLCGPICLAFCAQWLGVQADIGHLAEETGASASGTSLGALADAAKARGLEARCLRLSLDDLRRVSSRTPAIAHVDRDHFVVAWTANDRDVVVVEPNMSSSRIPLKNFGRRWDGNILLLSRPGEQPTFSWRIGWVGGSVGSAAMLLALLLFVTGRRRPKKMASR